MNSVFARKHGLSCYNPQMKEWSTRYIPLEAAVKDSCRLLFYVISLDTRGIASMLEVFTPAMIIDQELIIPQIICYY
jgi:hypothetical protein